ncbi:uncharacterized protein LOC106084886 [Stomoxys calcitrans]|uniref:Uncharacterized protein n=1 Tax=Stomoxys calcitrans TaxID=35570 RepID=A0A1I8NSN1_STOCA|nr:uncharacterized protein LOC106084886 [Stomoxys calcitrans]
MVNTAVQKWMSNEMERLSSKWERYKPACSGYNRIHSARLSKSVTHMLNNPLPAQDRLGCSSSASAAANKQRRHSNGQVLSRRQPEWEEVYPDVRYQCQDVDNESEEKAQKFAYYRNCSTRIT